MKKIVLFGAFDRYNYGDNLMPVLFQLFVEKYAKHVLREFEFEYAAISSSNLEKFCCYKTNSINEIIDTLPGGSAVVVIGGEVLCGRNQSLFLHMQDNFIHHFSLKVFKKLLPRLFNYYAKSQYSTKWEFPFIPANKFFTNDVKVIFNTVGGDVNNLTPTELLDVKDRIVGSAYLSVRDKRTFNNLQVLGKEAVLAPDSAYIMSALIDKATLAKQVRQKLFVTLPDDYFVFQAAPNKVGSSVSDCVNYILALSQQSNKKVVLLPIGYASGHDDLYLLQKIHKAIPDNTALFHNLTLWEIMFVITNSAAYFGTSLHGAITAMSFDIPHFGINKNITKLNAFLDDWSVSPFNQCYSIENIAGLPSLITAESLANLKAKTALNINKVKHNYQEILSCIDNNYQADNLS
ncbi:hypothetical protein GCM10009111_13210 [Colwellia asteriadis]|uniref:Polysaccharide pyruvyl transferase domain-containing protein n=1 Tax=Colwellia asteriadis TaxID=517723 RepID=A0ABN1L680_9GAMM